MIEEPVETGLACGHADAMEGAVCQNILVLGCVGRICFKFYVRSTVAAKAGTNASHLQVIKDFLSAAHMLQQGTIAVACSRCRICERIGPGERTKRVKVLLLHLHSLTSMCANLQEFCCM